MLKLKYENQSSVKSVWDDHSSDHLKVVVLDK